MKKYFFILFVIFLFFMSTHKIHYAYADNPTLTTGVNNLQIITNIPDAVSQNISRDWRLQVFNSTSVLTSGLNCYLDIYNEYSNGSLIWQNITSTFSGTSIIANVSGNRFSDKGVYSFRAYCNTTNQAGLYLKNFYVTKGGQVPGSDNLSIFIFILFILSSIGLFYTFIMTFAKLVTLSVTLWDVLISLGFFILTSIVILLAENYLILTFIERISTNFLSITAFTNGFFPFIAFVITFLVTLLQKKRSPNVQELTRWR